MPSTRRNFLRQTGALSAAALAGNLSRWAVPCAQAQAAADYKAIVCVFLFGGNDANNMVIPYTDYADYAAVRTAASNVAIPQANLIQFGANGKTYGFHPSLQPLQPVYASGKLAVIANAGTLLRPMTKADYAANRYRPANLYSHSDQVNAWQGLLPDAVVRTGWGGRMADRTLAANSGAGLPPIVSVSGAQIYASGSATAPFVIPSSGGSNLSGQGTDAVSRARYTALKALLAQNGGNEIVAGAAGVMDKALNAADIANPILTATLPAAIQTAFTVNAVQLNTGIAQQLKQVARLIDARTVTGVKRQFFFVGLGGFDTHSNTVTNQTNLFNQLAAAMKAFYDYTVAAGVAANVTTFTMSDFSRTFIGNSNAGVDHAWGGHHLVLGGAVRGGAMYGTFPQLAVRGPDDAGTNGAWIPTTSVDQIGGTLGRWFGVSDVDLDAIFPNLANFGTTATRYLGFV
jgi:uncharacterized protein (DUF1501 family)